MIKKWFAVEEIDDRTYAISEYKHWERNHSYLLLGKEQACLIDTGLGIANIKEITDSLTDLPIRVITTHVHWDHIGGHHLYNNISVHENEIGWLKKGIPVPLEQIKQNLVKGLNGDKLPEGFDINNYQLFTGEADYILKNNDEIDIGDRLLQVLHTPGHSPGHICLYERERGYLFSGDIIYQGTLYAFYPTTDPGDFYKSIIKLNKLDFVQKILPGHNEIEINNEILREIKLAFEGLKEEKLLYHGSGSHKYGKFSIKL